MGRKISASDFPPSAELRMEGAEITGVFKGSREIKTKYGLKTVFMLKVSDANCTFTKNEQPHEPVIGDEVEIMGTTLLTNQLKQVKVGETVHIKYAGLGTGTKGNPPHMFDVEVL
jgi:hypothetical protein